MCPPHMCPPPTPSLSFKRPAQLSFSLSHRGLCSASPHPHARGARMQCSAAPRMLSACSAPRHTCTRVPSSLARVRAVEHGLERHHEHGGEQGARAEQSAQQGDGRRHLVRHVVPQLVRVPVRERVRRRSAQPLLRLAKAALNRVTFASAHAALAAATARAAATRATRTAVATCARVRAGLWRTRAARRAPCCTTWR